MNPVRGIFLMMSAVTLFTVMLAIIKGVARVPAGEAMFFRSLFALPVILAWLWSRDELRTGVRTQNLRAHFARGIVGSCAMGLGFAGLRFLPLPEVTAIQFTTPVILVVLAAFMLGERIRAIRIGAVTMGLIGVTIIIWPRLTFEGDASALIGVGMILTSAALAALAQIFVKSMSGTETTAAIVFYFTLTSTILSLLTLPFGWVWLTPAEWGLLVAAGLIGGTGQLLLTASYRFADAGVLAPFSYISMLWSVIISWVWFEEAPTMQMLAGASLVILAGIIIVLRERQLGSDATARRKVRAKGFQ